MKRICLHMVLFFLASVSQALAQNKLPSNMFFEKLKNGLDVLVIEDHTVPLATIMITVKNGSFTESPRFNGLSHLYEHMFFKANKYYKSRESFSAKEAELGIRSNATTSYEKVNYFFTLPRKNLSGGLSFMNDAIRYPKFDKKEMDLENTIVDAEFQRKESNPSYALNDAMSHHLWGDLYSRRNPIGNHDIIRTATPDLMDSIKNKYYYPNNSFLSIAGDVSHEEVFRMVENIFGSWKPSPFDPFERWPVPVFRPLDHSDCFVVESPLAKVPLILFNWQGPEMEDDVTSSYAADVFSYSVEQNSSRLKTALIQSGLALDLDFNYLTLKHKGPISLLIVPTPGKVKECFEEAKRQIQLFDSPQYLTDEQIEGAKRTLNVNKVLERESALDYSEELSFWWASTSLDYFSSYFDNVNKITRGDIQNYIRRYIKSAPYCAGLLLNADQKAQLHPETFFNAN